MPDFSYPIQVLKQRLYLTETRLRFPCSPEMEKILKDKIESIKGAIEMLSEVVSPSHTDKG